MHPARTFGHRRLAPLGVGVMLAAGALALFGAGGPAEPPPVAAVQAEVRPAAAAAAPAAVVDAVRSPPGRPDPRAVPPKARPAPEPVSAGLARAFAASTDLRAFVARAVQQPQAGGVFYARRALAECRLRAAPDTDPGPGLPSTGSHRREQAAAAQADGHARRCAAFLPEEIADAAMEGLQQQGLQAGDPLLAVMHAWVEALDADDPAALRRLLAVALQQGDPALLEVMGQAGSGLFQPATRDDPGTPESARIDHQQLWDALVCELGAGCRAPRGPPDALCEHLLRCAAERFGSAPSSVVPGTAGADAVAEVRRRVELVRRQQGVALLGP